MFRNILFWILALVITLASAVYQRATGPTYPVAVSRNAAVTYFTGGKCYLLVASGGPYGGTAGGRDPRCFYAEVTLDYKDLAKFAGLQACYDPASVAPSACRVYDLERDSVIDFADYLKFEERFAGPSILWP